MWWKAYMNKPWAAVPNPPHSYTCGELIRAVLRDIHGVETPEIVVNAAVLRDCVTGIADYQRYGLRDLLPGEAPQKFDVVYLCQAERPDHVGMYVETADGAMVLHCSQGTGVALDSLFELTASCYRKVFFRRHASQEHGAVCPK